MYREFLDFIFPLAEGAGKIQLAYFRGDDLAIRTKSNVYDVVTRADKESEAYIAAAILERWPDHEILGEEGGSMGRAGSDYRWVVDPLDGTTNYSQGLPVFSVSIALQYRGETIAGVVYAPYLNELFWASKGGGAYMKSRSGDPRHVGHRHRIPVRQGRQSGQQQRQRRAHHPLRAGRAAAGVGGLRPELCRGGTSGRLLGAGSARVGRVRRESDRPGGRGRRCGLQARPRSVAGRGQ